MIGDVSATGAADSDVAGAGLAAGDGAEAGSAARGAASTSAGTDAASNIAATEPPRKPAFIPCFIVCNRSILLSAAQPGRLPCYLPVSAGFIKHGTFRWAESPAGVTQRGNRANRCGGMVFDRRLLPLAAAIAGVAVFSVMDAMMKRAATEVGAYSAVLFRSLIGACLMWPLWRLTGGRWPDAVRLKLHLLRSAVVAGMAWTFFYGLVRVPMAEGIALSFFAPIIALYLAAVQLGEKIRPRAIIASLMGFAGVIVIAAARIGSEGRGSEVLMGVAAIIVSAVLYAWNLVLQRRQAQIASPQEVALFQNLCVGGLLALLSPFLAQVPSGPALLDIAGAAVLAATALMLLAWAYARAEAQALVATEYTAFVWAALMGWLWFGESVTLATVAGVALIVAACWIAARGSRAEATSV